MSSMFVRHLRELVREPGSYRQSSLAPASNWFDPYGQIGVGQRGAGSPGGGSAATGITGPLTERDPALRTYHSKQTVSNAQGVSMDITPIKTVTFEDGNGRRVVMEFADAPLQKIADM